MYFWGYNNLAGTIFVTKYEINILQILRWENMCGITGFVDNNFRLSKDSLHVAAAQLNYRDKNDCGTIFEQNDYFRVAMASYMPSTTDPSGLIKQPLSSGCGDYSIAFNGAIYNYVELRETLIKYGVIFNTLTDTEVLLECYKKWGHKAFEKMDGSYSFALLDRKLHQLIIARDSIGTKPLYYYKTKGTYLFASTIKAILAYPGVDKQINRKAIATYFRYGYMAGNETLYHEINLFKKGTLTIIDLHSGNSYDTPIPMGKKNTEAASETEEQVIARVEELITDSILKRNVANVPTGMMLGNDYCSTALAAVLQKNQSKRIKTFTVGFEHKKFNKAPGAKKIAGYLKTNHHEFYFDTKQATTILEKFPDIFEEPMGNSEALPLLFAAQNIQDEAKVLLFSDSSNILFGGHENYSKALAYEALPGHIPGYLKDFFGFFLKYMPAKTREALKAADLLDKYLEISACFSYNEIENLLGFTDYYSINKAKPKTTITDLLSFDFENLLPNNLLNCQNKCLMYYGIDNRDSFLKTDLVNYLFALDDKWFIKNGQRKYLLKKITDKYIPEQFVKTNEKDLGIPLTNWLKTCFKPYLETYLNAEQLNKHQLLNVNEVLAIKAAFYANSNAVNTKKVWLLLQFQLWHERWMA